MTPPSPAGPRQRADAALRRARDRVCSALAWSRARHGDRGLALRAVAVLALGGLLVSSLVVGVLVIRSDAPVQPPARVGDGAVSGSQDSGPPEDWVPPSVRTAADMAGRMRSLDQEQRAAMVRARVIPHRSTRFLRGLDEAAQAGAERWGSIEATPVAYEVLDGSAADAYVSVLSRVERVRADAGPDADPVSTWDVSRFGVVQKWDAWWVFVYGGSTADLEPGDPELDGFTRLP